MGWRDENTAIFSDPDHLRGVRFDPSDDIHVLMPADPSVLTNIQESAQIEYSGDSLKISLVKFEKQ